jgi:hypothetical protein
LSLSGTGRWKNGRLELDIARLSVRGVAYLSPDGMAGATGGHAEVRGRLSWTPGAVIAADLQGTLGVKEVLAGSFYGNFAALPLTLEGTGRWQPSERGLTLEQATLSAPGLGRLEGRGSWDAGAWKARGEVQIPDLAEVSAGPLQGVFGLFGQVLAGIRLEGGLGLVFDGALDPVGWRLAGELRPDSLGLELPGTKLSAAGVSGLIPFRIGPAFPRDGDKRSGRLAVDRLQFGPVRLIDADLKLVGSPDRLAFGDPLTLRLAGGEAKISGLRFARRPEGLLVGGRGELHNIDLGKLTTALEITPMAGTLSADLGEFELLGGELLSEGRARIEVFGGTIVASNLRAGDLFSPYRTFAGDLDLTAIDLHQLTRTFAFGEINGILDGYIHDLRLFGSVPSAFVAEVETREKGRRNISVKALNNLAVISQGGLSAALSRGLYRFIDFYRYRKIGFFCALKNDVFLLKGTARKGSDRYLVYGGWLPPKIDILAPASTISFKEMLGRIQRIDRSRNR